MIYILKLDHRPIRDKRVSMHCALVGRAFKAAGFFYTGIKDSNFEVNIKKVVENWGGVFEVGFVENPNSFVKKFNGLKIHLTMYGESVSKIVKKINVDENILLIVGGPKVNEFYYENSDYNVCVGKQPHSEIAAITVFLYMLQPSCIDIDDFNGKNKIE